MKKREKLGKDELIKRGELIFDDRNANKGTRRGRAMVLSSLESYGAGRSVLADRHGRIIAGNKTLEAAQKLDMPTRVVETDGKELIVVKRKDLDLKKGTKAAELAVADNQTSAVGLRWDADIMADLRLNADLSGLFTEEELDKITEDASDVDPTDEIPEMAIEPFEHYDYIVLVFRDSRDFLVGCEQFGIQRVKFTFEGKKKKKAAAKIGLGRCIDGAAFLKRATIRLK